MKVTPCYNCEDRYLGCKSVCPKEAEWQAERKAEKETIIKNRNKEREFWRYKTKRQRTGGTVDDFRGLFGKNYLDDYAPIEIQEPLRGSYDALPDVLGF